MLKSLLLIATALLLFIGSPAWSESYQYMDAQTVKQKLETEAPLSLVDIQVEEEYAQHRIVGALPSYAYPVKTAADRAKLTAISEQLKTSDAPVVIVCPRGGGGAKRAYDYLLTEGIDAKRLFILEQGQHGWPFPELLVKN